MPDDEKFIPNDPKFVCDICGFAVRRSKTRKNWRNQIVCQECYEPRHPQDSIRPIREKIAVRDARPEPTETFLSVGEVTSEDL